MQKGSGSSVTFVHKLSIPSGEDEKGKYRPLKTVGGVIGCIEDTQESLGTKRTTITIQYVLAKILL